MRGSSLLLPAPSLALSLLSSDTNTVVGLPRPIHESIRTLKLVSTLMNSSSPCSCVGAPSPSPRNYHRSEPVVHFPDPSPTCSAL